MHYIKTIGLLLYAIYFSFLLTGHPEKKLEFSENIIVLSDEVDSQDSQSVWYWKLGNFSRVLRQHQALSDFMEPVLEGDLKPEAIFRRLNRSLIQGYFILAFNVFWLFLIFLSLLAIRFHYKFLDVQLFFIVMLSSLYLITLSFLYRYEEWEGYIFSEASISVQSIFEMGLLFISFFILIKYYIFDKRKAKKITNREGEITSVSLIVSSGFSFSKSGRYILQGILHFFLISLFSVLLSNLFLFPLYTLQLSFPNLFTFFLIGGLLMLGLYYAYSYWQRICLTSPKGKMGFSLGLNFLNYRLLQNMIFFIGMAFLITIAIGSIIVIATYNMNFLQEFTPSL